MRFPRFLKLLQRTGWEFWLPLPLIAALFWLAGNLVANHVLKRPFESVHKLQADRHRDEKLSATVLTVNADINKSKGVTMVNVKTVNSALNDLRFEFSTTETAQVEAAIAQKLKIPVESVRKLISYRVID